MGGGGAVAFFVQDSLWWTPQKIIDTPVVEEDSALAYVLSVRCQSAKCEHEPNLVVRVKNVADKWLTAKCMDMASDRFPQRTATSQTPLTTLTAKRKRTQYRNINCLVVTFGGVGREILQLPDAAPTMQLMLLSIR